MASPGTSGHGAPLSEASGLSLCLAEQLRPLANTAEGHQGRTDKKGPVHWAVSSLHAHGRGDSRTARTPIRLLAAGPGNVLPWNTHLGVPRDEGRSSCETMAILDLVPFKIHMYY